MAPGVLVEHTFDMRRRVLHLRVVEADGTPASQRLILLRGGMVLDAPERDADGWITIDPMPPRPVEVLTYPRGFDAAARAATDPKARQQLVIRLGPVTAGADQQPARVELRIPPGR